MATVKKASQAKPAANEVDAFLAQLQHPLKAELETVRATILGANPAIREGIKWNSPSFRTGEWFATINTRKDAVLVILHLGARAKGATASKPAIRDPSGLLEWLARDRAAVWFRDHKAVQAGREALADIVRQWIAFVPAAERG